MQHFLNLVQAELERARHLHPPIASLHEGYGVLAEEFRELELEIFKHHDQRDKEALCHELVQIAAMCMRAAEDTGLLWDGNIREPLGGTESPSTGHGSDDA